MKGFKFIHTSDIHLGSILHIGSYEDSNIKELLNDSIYDVFKNICRAAIERDVQFIIIAGDLYDKEYRSVRANRFFTDCCRELNQHDIQVIVLMGNHDPYGEYRELFALPSNVHILDSKKPEILIVKSHGEPIARVVGQSYDSKNQSKPLHLGYPDLDSQLFNIGVLHTQMKSDDTKYIPCNMGELLNKESYKYWALGHIHRPSIISPQNPVVAYSGIPQGRDFGEQDMGGCYLVEVRGNEVFNMEFFQTSKVVYKEIEIDISNEKLKGAENLSQLEDFIFNEISASVSLGSSNKFYGLPVHSIWGIEGYIVRLILRGSGNMHYVLNQTEDGLREYVELLNDRFHTNSPFIHIDSMVCQTSSPKACENILQGQELLKELMDKTIQDCLTNPAIRKEMVGRLGNMWHVSDDYEEEDELRLRLDSSIYESIIEDAKRIILEGLAERRE